MNTQEIRIQVVFRIDTKYGIFQDALWFSKEEYERITQEDIDKMEQERVDNWVKIVTTPAPELSDVEKVAQVQSQIDFHTLRIQELQTEKEAMTKVK